VRYEVEPGDATEAYLLRPAVVVFHSTVDNSILQPAGVGMGKDAPRQLGIGLAKRGYVALCPRNYLWPENTKMSLDEAVTRFRGRHPGAKGMAKMLYDAIVALNILANLPEVDPDRLGTVGHSLGARETLYLAAIGNLCLLLRLYDRRGARIGNVIYRTARVLSAGVFFAPLRREG
jgi:dienelactone hydrolase